MRLVSLGHWGPNLATVQTQCGRRCKNKHRRRRATPSLPVCPRIRKLSLATTTMLPPSFFRQFNRQFVEWHNTRQRSAFARQRVSNHCSLSGNKKWILHLGRHRCSKCSGLLLSVFLKQIIGTSRINRDHGLFKSVVCPLQCAESASFIGFLNGG